jgi:hypothetical protein
MFDGGSPSLSSSLPPALLKKLEKRNIGAAKTEKEKEKENADAAPSSPPPPRKKETVRSSPKPADKDRAPASTEQQRASPRGLAAGSPSKCVVEAQRLEEARKLRRQQQALVRAERGELDEAGEYQVCRAVHSPCRSNAAHSPSGRVAARSR